MREFTVGAYTEDGYSLVALRGCGGVEKYSWYWTPSSCITEGTYSLHFGADTGLIAFSQICMALLAEHMSSTAFSGDDTCGIDIQHFHIISFLNQHFSTMVFSTSASVSASASAFATYISIA